MSIICFHNPDEINGYFSNWYLSDFTCEGIQFSSMEQYMMYKKAETFKDYAIMSDILKTDDVAKIKRLGRQVRGYNDTIWSGIRQVVIYNGLMAKFSQNDELKERLLETGDSILAECAVKDRIWGIGLSMHDAERFDMTKWRGQNLLGFTLVLVRKALRG